MELKVVYFSQSIVPSRYANSIHVMKMCNALANAGARVTLLASRGNEETCEDVFGYYGVEASLDIRYLPWPRFRGGASLYLTAGLLAVLGQRADLVYGRYVRGCYLASLIGRPVVFEVHIDVNHWRAGERWMLDRLMKSPNLKGLVVISEPLKEHYARTYGLDERLIFVAPDGADESSKVVPASLSQTERLQVGYVGHLYPGRGLELIESLAEQCPWADFHVVGGTEHDIEHWRERSHDADNLTFHGFVPPARTASFRAAFDVALAPYGSKVTIAGKTDTTVYMSPLKLFEYMASGNAIVCSDIPVLREVMTHGHNCLMCPPQDLGAWRQALAQLRDDKPLRQRLATNALSRLENKYTWRGRAENILGHFGYGQ